MTLSFFGKLRMPWQKFDACFTDEAHRAQRKSNCLFAVASNYRKRDKKRRHIKYSMPFGRKFQEAGARFLNAALSSI
jgi:hypothetical protein